MNQRHPDAEEVNCVLVGSFNPGIFHPEWFRRQEILLPAEAEQAQVRVVTPDVTEILFLDMRLDVLPDRFVFRTQDASSAEKLHDIVLAVFHRLPHTPVTACGINNEIHFDLGDEAYWHKIGHTLAPKELVWNEVLEKPGLQSLTIKGIRTGDFPGEVNVTVQPSKRFRFGLCVGSNSHFPVPRDDSGMPCSEKAISFLTAEWKTALEQSRRVAYRLFNSISKDAK
ncbi:MAG: hypothetical protein HZA90_08915 [Verrucomicrobia bacterium]|nr:hypothetical protein [Verrucomicrobiota bacterium]